MNQFLKKIASILATTVLLTTAGMALAQEADTSLPADVDNVKAEAGDGQITLRWDQATDNIGVTGYKIYMGTESVTDSNKDYNLPTVAAGNVTEYIVKNLNNGTPYYFAMTAVDQAGKESEYYSTEISAIPQAAGAKTGADKIAPTVREAKATSDTEVSVIFSETVVLPDQAPESVFKIEDKTKNKQLVVIAAQLDPKDVNGQTVVLTTEPQEADITYVLTVGLEITDSAGNPVESGLADTASFKGGSEKAEPADTASPKVVNAKSLSPTQVQVEFSEPVILGATPAENFKISQSSDAAVMVAVLGAEIDVNDEKFVIVTTEAQKPQIEYVLEVNKVADKSGNLLAEGFDATAIFTSNENQLSDLIPPEEVTKFVAKMTATVAKLTWTASLNSAGDLADQILYMSLDKGKTYDKGKSLGSTVTKYDAKDLKPDTEYTFKLTVKDKVGNESKGVVLTVKTLPQTGPGLGLLALAALGAAGYVTKRKK